MWTTKKAPWRLAGDRYLREHGPTPRETLIRHMMPWVPGGIASRRTMSIRAYQAAARGHQVQPDGTHHKHGNRFDVGARRVAVDALNHAVTCGTWTRLVSADGDVVISYVDTLLPAPTRPDDPVAVHDRASRALRKTIHHHTGMRWDRTPRATGPLIDLCEEHGIDPASTLRRMLAAEEITLLATRSRVWKHLFTNTEKETAA